MRYHTSTSNKEIHYFTCSDNKVDYRGKCSGRHYVRADALEEVVKLELRQLVEMLEIDESYFAQLLLRKNDEKREKDKKFLESELQKAIARSNTVSNFMKSYMRMMLSEKSATNGLLSYLINTKKSVWT